MSIRAVEVADPKWDTVWWRLKGANFPGRYGLRIANNVLPRLLNTLPRQLYTRSYLAQSHFNWEMQVAIKTRSWEGDDYRRE